MKINFDILGWVLTTIAGVLKLVAFFINKRKYCKENKTECDNAANLYSNIIEKINSSSDKWFFNSSAILSFLVAIITFVVYRKFLKENDHRYLPFLNMFLIIVAVVGFILRIVDWSLETKSKGVVKTYEILDYIYYTMYATFLISILLSKNRTLKKRAKQVVIDASRKLQRKPAKTFITPPKNIETAPKQKQE